MTREVRSIAIRLARSMGRGKQSIVMRNFIIRGRFNGGAGILAMRLNHLTFRLGSNGALFRVSRLTEQPIVLALVRISLMCYLVPRMLRALFTGVRAVSTL